MMGNLREIRLPEALSLEKIADSGQCFRAAEIEKGLYRYSSGEHLLYARQASETSLLVSCGEEEWERVWSLYFDLERSYDAICGESPENDAYLRASIEFGRGIRVLRQEPWEMLVSFILSQRKSIPAIRTSIERLCSGFGEKRRSSCEEGEVSLFPSPERVFAMSPEELSLCGLGYRSAYVHDAAAKVVRGELSLKEIGALPDEELYEALCSVYGVGKKVANCIMLFAYGRTERVPEDIWIHRITEKKYNGKNPFPEYHHAGILQQYMFYYAISHKEEF